MTTAVKKTAEEVKQSKLEARSNVLMKTMTNKQKREVIRYFDCKFEELDGLDLTVVIAHLADKSRSVEEYDDMPIGDLESIILGE